MASQSQGIQQLLAAEKRAAEKVAEARKSNNFARQKQKFIFIKLFLILTFRKTTSTKTSKGRGARGD